MKKHYSRMSFIFMTILLLSLQGIAQNNKQLWTKTSNSNFSVEELEIRKTEPKKGMYFKLDLEGLKEILATVPDRSQTPGTSNVIVDFPNANGKLEPFRVMEASVMHPELQARYSDLRSYVGQSVDNPSKTIRFSVTPKGLHTIMLSGDEGSQFIDPYAKNSHTYLVYAKRDLPALEKDFICDFENDENFDENIDFDLDTARNANDGQLRNFRLALASTIEYSSFQWMAAGLTAGASQAAKKVAVMDAMTVTITRVNAIYERDLSITMTFVPNNDAIIFIDSDNFNNDNANVLINQSQTVIDGVIGFSNYDIGHTFSTGGGGLASLNSPCTANKARGITGLPNPVGDAYDIDFVSHEIGHQFGAPHTFNGNTGNCAGTNRSPTNAYEPGSGSTIMAYAGICAPQNVQANSDAYFHQKSLQMIWNNITNGNSQCASVSSTGNSAPTANAGPNYTIPISTPYKLTASSTDADGTSTHTYTWEQYDLGPTGAPTETAVSGPIVRSFEGTTNPSRYIPSLPDLLQSAGSTSWEKLSSVSRNMNFRVTVRDNDVRGGQTASDNMLVNTVTAAGPFLVTSQNTSNISWTQGATENITWNVANTTGNGVNTANVNILLSTDGGLTYDTVLASNVPNNGSYNIVVPNIVAPYCRVMVEAVENIFFNINTTTFAIGTTVSETCNTYNSGNVALAIPDGLNLSGSSPGAPVFSSINVTEDMTIGDANTSIKFHVDITHPSTGEFLIQIQHPDVSTNNAFVNVYLGNCPGQSNLDITFAAGAPAIVCASPISGEYAPANSMAIFNGLSSAGIWKIAVVDYFAGNIGTLNNWDIEICTTSLSTDKFEALHDLSVFPNPSNGEFNIRFNSTSNKDVNVEVFDIRGRKVFGNRYTHTGTFNQSVKLNNIQSGIYLLNISEGNRKVTKKIIIN